MDNAKYVALSRQMAQTRHMDIIANNVANSATTGYKADSLMFTDYLAKEGHRSKLAYAQDIGMHRDTAQGGMKYTGNPLDVALEGSGYFVVNTEQGPRYTRAGSFQISAEGTLVTGSGDPVMGFGGTNILFQPTDREVMIAKDGAIIVDGEERGALDVVTFEDEQKLTRVSGTLFAAKDATPLPATDFVLQQGVLEGSNVEPVLEITEMMKVIRSVGSTSQFIETIQELQRRAIQTYTQEA